MNSRSRGLQAVPATSFSATLLGQNIELLLAFHGTEVRAAAEAGTPPIWIIAPFIEPDAFHSRERQRNIGDMIREWLGPLFERDGRYPRRIDHLGAPIRLAYAFRYKRVGT